MTATDIAIVGLGRIAGDQHVLANGADPARLADRAACDRRQGHLARGCQTLASGPAVALAAVRHGVFDPGINATSILTHLLHGAALDSEYPRIDDRFAGLIAAHRSDVDLSPMTLVADAFMLARHRRTDPFHDEQNP